MGKKSPMIWEPTRPGISNTQWFVSDWGMDWGMAFVQNQRHIVAEFRDRRGDKWKTVETVSNELIADPLASRWILEIIWKHFKRYIESRYNQVQPWESSDLNPRSRQWKYEHPEETARFYPSWDDAEEETPSP
jgi:hypothetical protein